ncbi:hypothetical protein MVEG_05701 [Podila verticillata NRRL 6337]|nr:hypothetical protein MVEG_05701 [Podila verticillata NRRL 6337]
MKSCGLQPSTLYSCNAAGVNLVCGASLHKKCKAVDNAIYSCSGYGTYPKLFAKCRPGSQCRVGPHGVVCGFYNCNCTGTEQVCSGLFPDRTTTVLLETSASFKIPTTFVAMRSQRAADWIPKPCTAALVVMRTPRRYKIALTETAQSRGDGADPIPGSKCDKGCIISPDGDDKCNYNPCECAKVGDTCSQAYPASCGYVANTLYKCEAKGKLPVKGDACASDQACKVVPGGADICGPAILCECKGAGKICSDQYQPACKFLKDTVITCPGLTQTPCPIGCVNGECKTDCKCTETGLKCGSSFAAQCNLIPNSLYK